MIATLGPRCETGGISAMDFFPPAHPSWPTPETKLGELAAQLKARAIEVVTYDKDHPTVAITAFWPSQPDVACTNVSAEPTAQPRETWFLTGTEHRGLTEESEPIAPVRPMWDAVQEVHRRLRR